MRVIKQPLFRLLPILLFMLLTSCSLTEEPLHVQLLSINDFHGQLTTTDKLENQMVGSAPYMASYIQQQRAKAPTLLIHAGDLVGGSPPISALLQDEPTITLANQLKFDLGTVGNHEFDEGVAELKRLINGGSHPKTGKFSGANFPYIVANVRMKDTYQLILPPYVIKKVSGIPIGFIGVVTKETANLVNPDKIKEIEFTDEITAINKQVRVLKKKGVETIVVIAHEGGNQKEGGQEITGPIAKIAKQIDSEVDVILSGHSHTRLNGEVAGKIIVQARNYGMAISKVDLTIDRQSKEVVQKRGEIIQTFHNRMKPDPQVQKFVEQVQAKVQPIISQKIAKNRLELTYKKQPKGETALGNLVADSQRWKMKTDFAVVNPGGIRANLPAGDIMWGDVYAVQPFGNSLIKMELTGEQIRRLLNQQFQDPKEPQMLQISGFKYRLDKDRPANDRILELKKADGTPIEPKQTYTVAMNSFLAAGGDHFTVCTEGKRLQEASIDIDAFTEYLQQLPQPIFSQVDGRIQQ